MKARAIAVANERSNAVGTVELECMPHGLSVTYLGVGSFSDGYAPGALTQGTHVLVPWASVVEASLGGEELFLHVDDKVTPHSRMTLTHFSTADAPHPAQLYRRRLVLRVALVGLFAVLVLILGLVLPSIAPEFGAAVIVVGCTAGAVLFGLGILADHRLAHGGTSSETARAVFSAELARYLPQMIVTRTAPRPGPPAIPTTVAAFQAMLPRTTSAVVITLSAGLLGATLTSAWVLRERDRPTTERGSAVQTPREAPEPAPRQPAAQSPAPAPPPADPAPPPTPTAGGPVTTLGPCTCPRGDSVLWRSKIPRLSTLLIERRERPHKDHVHLELEVGIVNNGDAPIDEVNLLVQFYERTPPPTSERKPTYDRPLYFEGPLRPGQAIKWHVEARGTEFDVFHSIEGSLTRDGENAAPADAFAELLDANHRPVRLHGAMMLGYLGDPRAKDGAVRLREALREDEGPYLGRLLRALGDVVTCNLDVEGKGRIVKIKSCVYNTSLEEESDLFIRTRALDREFDHSTPVAPPPIVLAETTHPIGASLPPQSGIVVSTALDTDNPDGRPAEMFETFAGAERDLY